MKIKRSFLGRDEKSLIPFILISALIFTTRSYPQFSNPQLYNEDITLLHNFANGGLKSIFSEVGGQSIWISAIPLFIGSGFLGIYPWIAAFSSLFIFLATICIFAYVKSDFLQLKSKKIFVVLLSLIPIYPETFGVALYNFWWASLWPMAIIFSSKTELN